MRGGDRAHEAKAGLLEQAGIFLDRALAPAAQHHHLQIEPSARTGAVIGRQRRLEHQHPRVRLHGAAHIGENAQAFRVVVVVHEMADQIEVAAFRRRVANTSPATNVTPGSGPPSPRLAAAIASAISNSVARRFG